MKRRLGFVSNSSSSSYIYYPEHPEETIKPKRQQNRAYDPVGLPEKKIGVKGCKEFGWGPEELHDSESKINWCFLQAGYACNEEFLEKIALVIEDYEECVIRDLSNLFTTEKPDRQYEICSLKFRGKEYYMDGFYYIDHQSTCLERPRNGKMLESMDKIRTFIYGEAFIVLQNDNDYDCDYYFENGA